MTLKVLAGFALGAVMAVLLPPLAFAIALVLTGVVWWQRRQADGEQQPLTPVAAGYVLAVAVYVVLVLIAVAT